MKQLRLGLIMSQFMAKHRQHVKNIMLGTCELNRDMLLTEQNVRVFYRKLAQKTYRLQKNDVKSVHMWVQQNTNLVFYYQETRVEVDGRTCLSLGRTCLSLWVSKHHGKGK